MHILSRVKRNDPQLRAPVKLAEWLTTCLKDWDAATHMTRKEWRTTCERGQSSGWVSAYAHADQIMVKRDDVVKRGQVIAKTGKTGTVDQPQLHFELRQGAKPVDPLPHMEK
jgi:hypothetical protein